MSALDDRSDPAPDVLRPLPRATGGGRAPRAGVAARSLVRPGYTGAQTAMRARQVGRSQSVREGLAGGAFDWLSRPRWTDVEPEPARKRFEPPITGDARYDALIRMVRRRRNPSRPAPPTPGPGLPRASARRGTTAGGGTGPGESGRRLTPYPVQPTPTPALKGVVASAAASPSTPRPFAAMAVATQTSTLVAPVAAPVAVVEAPRVAADTPRLIRPPHGALPTAPRSAPDRPRCTRVRTSRTSLVLPTCGVGARRLRCETGRRRQERRR